MDNKKLGDKGEALAAAYLKNKGYRILAQNWRFYHKEIDIIAENHDFIVFVEVKTRQDNFLQNPHESVNLKKEKNIIEAADEYVCSQNIEKEARFDIISVLAYNGKTSIRHIPDAFQPTF